MQSGGDCMLYLATHLSVIISACFRLVCIVIFAGGMCLPLCVNRSVRCVR